MALGNFNNSIIGDIEDMYVSILDQATIDGTSLAQFDLVALRVITRVAFTPGMTDLYSAISWA